MFVSTLMLVAGGSRGLGGGWAQQFHTFCACRVHRLLAARPLSAAAKPPSGLMVLKVKAEVV